jgi:hypothetical protein
MNGRLGAKKKLLLLIHSYHIVRLSIGFIIWFDLRISFSHKITSLREPLLIKNHNQSELYQIRP